MRILSILCTASILLGSFCPMSFVSAMQPAESIEHGAPLFEAVMSPYIPMTLAAPMSMEAVARSVPSSIVQVPGTCPGGMCIVTDHAQNQGIVFSRANGETQGGTPLPAALRSVTDAFASPISTPQRSRSHLLSTIGTVVLRV